jgi:hypothetical protein
MEKPTRNREQRRAARDKSVLDHLTKDPLKPRLNHKSSEARQHGEGEGRKLEKAIRKEWTPDKGGLPEW